ncbi:MAG: hypothetical protein JO130_18400 [Solirubrobacterales bacterium]|nr:hypothetical protein [Solirubrobacterales bacterium]
MSRATTPPEQDVCPWCSRTVWLDNGVLTMHAVQVGLAEYCPCSGLTPEQAQEKADEVKS